MIERLMVPVIPGYIRRVPNEDQTLPDPRGYTPNRSLYVTKDPDSHGWRTTLTLLALCSLADAGAVAAYLLLH